MFRTEEEDRQAYIDALKGLSNTPEANENYTPEVEDNQNIQDYYPYQIPQEDQDFYQINKPEAPRARYGSPEDVAAHNQAIASAPEIREYYSPEAVADRQAALDDFNRQAAIRNMEYENRMAKPFPNRRDNEAYNSYLSEIENLLMEGEREKALNNAGYLFDRMGEMVDANDYLRKQQSDYDAGISNAQWKMQQYQDAVQQALWENSPYKDIIGLAIANHMPRRKKNIEDGGVGVSLNGVNDSDQMDPMTHSYSVVPHGDVNPFMDNDEAQEFYTLLPNGMATHINNDWLQDPFSPLYDENNPFIQNMLKRR